jgi:hypothetical protein
MTYIKQISLLVTFVIIAFSSFSQKDMRMEFFPGTEEFSAAANVYSINSGDLTQYYMKDDTWTINPNIKSPKISIKGGNYRMQYTPESELYAANLFIYSCKSGEFEFLTLDNTEWKQNTILKSGKASFSASDVRMVFHTSTNKSTAFISANSTNGKEISILQMNEGEWMPLDFFPKKLK